MKGEGGSAAGLNVIDRRFSPLDVDIAGRYRSAAGCQSQRNRPPRSSARARD